MLSVGIEFRADIQEWAWTKRLKQKTETSICNLLFIETVQNVCIYGHSKIRRAVGLFNSNKLSFIYEMG